MYWSISRVRMDFDIIIILLTFGCFRALSEDIDDSAENTTSRIVGGFLADIKDFPWQVSITYKDQHNCGGSILNEKHILTAAHCTHGKSPRFMSVRYGSNFHDREGFTRDVQDFTEHPDYVSTEVHNNIAVIILKDAITEFGDKVDKIKLGGQSATIPETNSLVFISGWGKVNFKDPVMSDHLRFAELQITDRDECQNLYSKFKISHTIFCAGLVVPRRGICTGDEGGPLMFDGLQYGIALPDYANYGTDYPRMYTSVAAFKDFINKAIK